MSKSENLGGYSYQQGTNKLTHIEGTPPIDLGYDPNGNITTENSWTYVYDLSNQLIRVLDGSNQIAEYTYNGAGQRIKKVTQTETTIFHYDLWGHLIAETNQSGQMLAEYIYLGDTLLSMIKPGESAYYFHNDHLGTPQTLTDDTGNTAWKAAYTPFGEAVTTIEGVENPFRFPGQYYDQETGLHYNWNRYYDPKTGRYLTPDPVGFDAGHNLFVYVTNSPVNLIDVTGLFLQGDKEFLGHSDFTGSNCFDYNLEDRDAPAERHFRDLPESERDARLAIDSCNKDDFQRAMHRGQDYFTHREKGYQWKPQPPWKWDRKLPCFGFGHSCVGEFPDMDNEAWARAEKWTQQWVKQWVDKCKCCDPK